MSTQPFVPAQGTVGICALCRGRIRFIEYTQWNGAEFDVLDSWWAHDQHPADNHDAEVLA